MELKKWLLRFLAAAAVTALAFVGWNLVTDPFGVFGDRVFDWYAYDMTMNPRVAKIAYLDKRHADYDSYVIGSSKASSLSVDELNAYTGGRFYNMTWYGGDLSDELALAHYILDNYEVKRLVLTVDPQDTTQFGYEEDPVKDNLHWRVDGSSPLVFYAKYLFANPAYGADKLYHYFARGYLTDASQVYVAEKGVYNKQLRDVAPIDGMAEYLAREQNQFYLGHAEMRCASEAVAAVAEIRDACAAAGAELTVIGVPLYIDDLRRYDSAEFSDYARALAAVTDFYDFWGSNAVNDDLRYYYDSNHFRNAAGTMALAWIYGREDIYIPEEFGHLTTAENVEARLEALYAAIGETADPADYSRRLPVLMYHGFTSDPAEVGYNVVLLSDFEEQLAALAAAGYESVTLRELIDFVDHGAPLPDKPVLLTFDDGYSSVLSAAALMEQYGFSAVSAVIGVSVGHDTYRDTDHPITPHFSFAEAEPYVAAGALEIQSHSYDMHQVEALDGPNFREGLVPLRGESEAEFAAAAAEDWALAKAQIETGLGTVCDTLSYPYGFYSALSEVVLHDLGVRVTFTTEDGMNEVLKGLPQSLYVLHRINVDGGWSGETLLRVLSQKG